jgi:hypothetical protein
VVSDSRVHRWLRGARYTVATQADADDPIVLGCKELIDSYRRRSRLRYCTLEE